jgi:hypothetical protein
MSAFVAGMKVCLAWHCIGDVLVQASQSLYAVVVSRLSTDLLRRVTLLQGGLAQSYLIISSKHCFVTVANDAAGQSAYDIPANRTVFQAPRARRACPRSQVGCRRCLLILASPRNATALPINVYPISALADSSLCARPCVISAVCRPHVLLFQR